MARARRESRFAVDAWPGFVDALSTLLLSVIFLLVVFVLGQFLLAQLLQRGDERVETLEQQLETAEDELELERDTSADLQRSLARLSSDLQAILGERDALRGRLDETDSLRSQLEGQIVQLTNERTLLQRSLEEARATLSAESEDVDQLARQLRATQEELTAESEALREELAALTAARDALRAQLDESLRSGEEAQTALTERDRRLQELERTREAAQSDVTRLREQIATLTQQLTVLGETIEQQESEIDAQSETIADLGQRLNLALASEVAELSQARSEFFGRLRRLLREREDVRVVGDRFVFQSEVLFDTGEADIGAGGRGELAQLADTFQSIIEELPDDLNWVLQVDGHTDRRPINTPRFPSNWELSTSRAISVARFLVSQGIPAERVAARGFAEFQPLDPGNTEEAFRRNRRIEIKLTTR